MNVIEYRKTVATRLQLNETDLSVANKSLAVHTKAAKELRAKVKELESLTTQDKRIMEDLVGFA